MVLFISMLQLFKSAFQTWFIHRILTTVRNLQQTNCQEPEPHMVVHLLSPSTGEQSHMLHLWLQRRECLSFKWGKRTRKQQVLCWKWPLYRKTEAEYNSLVTDVQVPGPTLFFFYHLHSHPGAPLVSEMHTTAHSFSHGPWALNSCPWAFMQALY